mmetsp:Transcript_10623/g.19836  ORF Transcript_10623/g.19836 Transcript_10623/m.19836 type:complete len:459 (+) Transcript_10623:761-2137(+)
MKKGEDKHKSSHISKHDIYKQNTTTTKKVVRNLGSTAVVFPIMALFLVIPRMVMCSFLPIPTRKNQPLAFVSFMSRPRDELDQVHDGRLPDDVVKENQIMHNQAVQQSENLFYGYYSPNGGITEWDIDNVPSTWVHYSLCPNFLARTVNDDDSQQSHDSTYEYKTVVQDQGGALKRYPSSWEYLMEMDKRIIPPPFSNDDLAHVSLQPILNANECQEIIDECENHYWGWGSSVERYGTPAERVGHMLKLEDLSRSYTLVNFVLLPRLFPAIANTFPRLSLKPENLRLGGCRVVKYDASEGRVELGMHRDGLLATANIALNDLDEYVGGGTIVEGADERNEPIRIDRGHVLLHPGDVKHGGSPITHGVRYVLVLFILSTDIVPHEKYCLDRMERDMEAARAIPLDDSTRAGERERLFASAMKNCADACAFSHQPNEKTISSSDALENTFTESEISSMNC